MTAAYRHEITKGGDLIKQYHVDFVIHRDEDKPAYVVFPIDMLLRLSKHNLFTRIDDSAEDFIFQKGGTTSLVVYARAIEDVINFVQEAERDYGAPVFNRIRKVC